MRTMRILLTAVAMFVALLASAQNNVAYEDAQVRFTVVTDGVIRLEWQPEGKFTDNASFVASERGYPQVDYKVRKRGKNVEVTTSKMTLTYKMNSGKLTADNLTIKAADGFFTWKPGMKQKENLKGTFRTLDGLEGDLQTQTWVQDMKQGEHRQFEDGVLAKDGWTLIDESENLLFDDSDWAWVTERPEGECQDWYFMAYGHDYKAALKDFTVFAGKMPLPPRFTFGYWWSRYWAYTDRELRTLVDKFHAYDIPLDVLVIDMDWHYTDPGRGGWTGWTWNRSLFPDPQKFMGYLKENDLKVTVNLHPAEGFDHYEASYPALSKSLGRDASDKSRIEWVNSDKKFMTNMFEQVLHPMQKEGVDFWWLDWQQHIFDTKLEKLHNTWWINYAFFTDMERNGDKRPLLYHRWGGLGNHRYQIGFSGDATISWTSLEFQPYFTSTASNVLYGYWSHDIGGHLGDSIDPEMYTRWLQYGGFSPVMRTHSSKNGALNKEPWVFTSEYTDVIRQTVRQRYEMAPYIYTMARKGYDEGLSLCRPMYYDYPEAPQAYSFRSQYMFGDDMLIAPVTSPATDGYASVDVWLPEGQWYELHTGTMLQGGAVVKRHFALDEYGIYIKAGSVLPFYGDEVDNLDGNAEDVTVTVFPGAEGSFRMYEDAGNDKNYATEHAFTSISNSWDGAVQTVTISPREGSYEGMPAERRFKVKVVASAAPVEVTVNGLQVGYEYLAEGLSFVIDIPVDDCAALKTIKITYASDAPVLAEGFVGLSRRMARSIEALKFRTGADPIDDLAMMGTINEAILYDHMNAPALVDAFMKNYNALPEILKKQGLKEADIQWFLQHCGWKNK
ncbi:MAG: DUF5110 domain-containing protein [Bacteroidales bacterium]|nr:DUF5110 domain-containing protein [Bacteroidales bacterium]